MEDNNCVSRDNNASITPGDVQRIKPGAKGIRSNLWVNIC